ncbi:MAG: PH domain-containing protein [Acidobacteria bacterium]|nr:PH domain-containing protein [Acidobacteriota bacterium]
MTDDPLPPAGPPTPEAGPPTPEADPPTPEADPAAPPAGAPARPRWLGIHPGIRAVWRIGGLIATPIVGLVASVLARALQEAVRLPLPWWSIGLVVAPLWLAFHWWLAGRRFAAWRYALAPDELSVEHGVFWRLARTVPRVRIQHVDVHSGPLDRAYGLAQISIYTAGSAGAVETIPGLAPETAEALRDALLGLSSPP